MSRVSTNVKSVIEAALPDDLGDINAQEATELAYKTMNPAIYYSVTVILYACEIFVATQGIPVGKVFGIIAAFSGNTMSFFLPGLFVVCGFKKFAD